MNLAKEIDGSRASDAAGHSGQQPLLVPTIQEKTPEFASTPEVAFELRPPSVDFLECDEQPDIRFSSFTENLSQKPDSILFRALESIPKRKQRHRLIPQKVWN